MNFDERNLRNRKQDPGLAGEPSALNAANSFPNSVNRVEVSGIALDSPSARVREDLFWIKRESWGYRIQVSIVDLTRLILPGSVLDKIAAERIENIYDLSKTYRIFPKSVIDSTLALKSGKSMDTLTIEMELSDDLESLGTQIYPSIVSRFLTIPPRHSITASNGDDELGQVFKAGSELVRAVGEKTKPGGPARMDGRNWRGDRVSRSASDESALQFSAAIVSCCMSFANEGAARFLSERGLHACYFSLGTVRSYLDFNDILPSSLMGNLSGNQVIHAYTPTPMPHGDINISEYLRCTSPVRRYPDLINQRILVAAATDAPAPYSKTEIRDICRAVNDFSARYRAASARSFSLAHDESDPHVDARVWSGALLHSQLASGIQTGLVRADLLVEAESRFMSGKLSAGSTAALLLIDESKNAGLRSLKKKILDVCFRERRFAAALTKSLPELISGAKHELRMERSGDGAAQFLSVFSLAGKEIASGHGSAIKVKKAQHRARFEMLVSLCSFPRAEFPTFSAISSGLTDVEDRSVPTNLELGDLRSIFGEEFEVSLNKVASVTGTLAEIRLRDRYREITVVGQSASESLAVNRCVARALRYVQGKPLATDISNISVIEKDGEGPLVQRVGEILNNVGAKKTLIQLTAAKVSVNGWGKPSFKVEERDGTATAEISMTANSQVFTSSAVGENAARALEAASASLIKDLFAQKAVSMAELASFEKGQGKQNSLPALERLVRFAKEQGVEPPVFTQENQAPKGKRSWVCSCKFRIADGRELHFTAEMPNAAEAKAKVSDMTVKRLLTWGLAL